MDAMLKLAERYVGTPYLEGEFDCADLAQRVQWEVFGRLVELPTHRARPGGAMGQKREIRKWQDVLAIGIAAPQTGCGVLMFEPSASSDSDVLLWHIGTVFVDGPDVWVLHNSAAMGSALLQRLPDMRRQGMRVEGFYAWR